MNIKNRFVPNVREKEFSGELIKVVKLDPDNVLEIYSELAGTSENELVITKNNNKNTNYSVSVSKDGKLYPASAPYQELQAEYDIFNIIYNGFVKFTDNINDKNPRVTIVAETAEEDFMEDENNV